MSAQKDVPAEAIRAELKAWEKAFSDQNEGRKATRDEIKQYPEIAQKYKLYSKLRSRVSDAAPISSSSPPPPKRRKPSPPAQKPAPQPPSHPFALDPYDSPRKSSNVHHTPTNHDRKWIGPTPQKNGVAIGLFDFLSPESTSQEVITPSNRPAGAGLLGQSIAATPSKRRLAEAEEGADNKPFSSQKSLLEPNKLPSRTPQSVSKRLYLSQFLAANTPSRSRGSNPQTPSSRLRRGAGAVSKLIFGETPEYLKRDSQHSFSLMNKQTSGSRPGTAEDGALGADVPGIECAEPLRWSPIAVRLPRKPLGRTLSSLVQNLRDAQERELDEDLDVLREIENGPSTNVKPKRPKLLVRDSQAQEPTPFGPEDLGFESLGEELKVEENDESQGKAKVWKKKGQKRTTRRVTMRPVLGKWKPEQEWKGPEDDEDGIVEESQVTAGRGVEGGDGSESDFNGQSSGGDDGTTVTKKGKRLPKAKTPAASKGVERETEGTIKEKRGTKKVKAQPQNFRALKMRSKGGANGTGKPKSKFGKGGFRRR